MLIAKLNDRTRDTIIWQRARVSDIAEYVANAK